MHHTKVKADIGVAETIADLTSKGYVPCIPLSEHQSYDLVVILKDGSAVKLQVKYATLKKNGIIEVKFRTGWVDRHGIHMRHYKEREFDYYAVYCPEKETVVYVPNTPACPKVIRFDKPRNNQNKHVKWANCYLDMKRESSETIRHTPEKVKT